MKPDPVDTTNALMLQMMNIMVNGPDAVNISNISSSTPYSSSAAWMQTLSYASLALSLLAAFGAVLGKQWLNSYKAARVPGSLEERGEKRQKKLDGMECWRLQTILKSFLVLLQISLFLFGFSLSADMWIQQKTMSIVIMCTTAFGIFCYLTTILVSVFYPDSPFQTAETALFVVICKKFFALVLTLSATLLPRSYMSFGERIRRLFSAPLITRSTVDSSVKLSAIRWLLMTSTNPDVVEPAAAMVPVVQWAAEVDASPIYARLYETLATYRDRQELSVKCVKAMAHFFVESVKVTEYPRNRMMPRHTSGIKNYCIYDAFMAGRSAWDHLTMAKTADGRHKHMADVRTALRTMVVHGQQNILSRPDDGEVILRGNFQWRHHDGRSPSCEEFDWLVDYLVDRLDEQTDDGTQGDALLALSAMNGLGSDAKRASYVSALIRCMASTRPPRVRCAAVKCISDAREELSFIDGDSMPRGVDAHLFNQLFDALSTAVSLHDGETTVYLEASNNCYSRLIFVLTMNNEWRHRLTQNGHVQQCIRLFPTSSEADFYIAGICLHVDPSGNAPSLSSIHERLEELMRRAWLELGNVIMRDEDFQVHDYPEVLSALVTATKQNLPGSNHGVASLELQHLAMYVSRVSEILRIHSPDGNVLSAVQSFSDDLKRMLEYPNTQ